MFVDKEHSLMLDVIIERTKSKKSIDELLYWMIERELMACSTGDYKRDVAPINSGKYDEYDFEEEFGHRPTFFGLRG